MADYFLKTADTLTRIETEGKIIRFYYRDAVVKIEDTGNGLEYVYKDETKKLDYSELVELIVAHHIFQDSDLSNKSKATLFKGSILTEIIGV